MRTWLGVVGSASGAGACKPSSSAGRDVAAGVITSGFDLGLGPFTLMALGNCSGLGSKESANAAPGLAAKTIASIKLRMRLATVTFQNYLYGKFTGFCAL